MLVTALVLSTLLCASDSPQIGGNGSDGPFVPQANTTLETSVHGGVFQFTTIRIPPGVTVSLRGPNPARLLSQGSVDIEGVLEADAEPNVVAGSSRPGAGGYRGGRGQYLQGSEGLGPGGGFGGSSTLMPIHSGGSAAHATPGVTTPGGTAASTVIYGSAFPFALEGGSGGGGAAAPTGSYLFLNGGHGGGAVAVFADGPITVSGTVSARGGDVRYNLFPWVPPGIEIPGGAGSGGALLLRSLQRVTVSGQILATGGRVIPSFGPTTGAGGTGFIRIDAYAQPPDVAGATIDPAPLLCELPHLGEIAPARLGHVWKPRCAAVPSDLVGWWMATRTLSPPVALSFGTLHLDPTPGGGLTLIALLNTPTEGIDPLATFDFLIPNDPRLIGLTFYSQMLNLVTATGKPWLSNLLTSEVAK